MERKEFEQLALEHMDSLYRMAMHLTGHPDEAGDLVQETYLKALRVADRYEERGGGIRPWLFKILHNVFFSKLAKNKRSGSNYEDEPPGQSEEIAPGDASPAWDLASLDWEQVDGRLVAAIERLRPEYRSVLLLWGVEGLKYREIAEIHDVPIGTIMSRLHRARTVLAEELSEIAEEMGWSRGSTP